MGLDMYAYLAKRRNENAKKVYDTSGKMSDDWYVVDNNYCYWRKNRHLHNWMEKKYLENGGEDNSFNCSFLVLTIDDFVELRNDIKNGIVEQMDSQGFFYGENDYSAHKELDLKFCNFAISELRELGDEFAVIYTSWW
jgi:hypothetical protein